MFQQNGSFALKEYINAFGSNSEINYYIQAKRYKSSNKVQAKEIRELKGSIKKDKNGKPIPSTLISMVEHVHHKIRNAVIKA